MARFVYKLTIVTPDDKQEVPNRDYILSEIYTLIQKHATFSNEVVQIDTCPISEMTLFNEEDRDVNRVLDHVVRTWRSGTMEQLHHAMHEFYLLCKQEKPKEPVKLEPTELDVRSRLYSAVYPHLNSLFRPRVVSRGFHRHFPVWDTPISVFLDSTADDRDSTATAEETWEFVRVAIQQEFERIFSEGHPLYRYSPGWTLRSIAKMLS